MPSIGSLIDAFELPANGGQTISMDSFKGKNLVLYFYPKDSTPGCTKEGQAFRDLYVAFQAENADILGVSKDSVRAHDNFIAKYEFPFNLLSDKEEVLCQRFDVIKEKNMYGRAFMGVERSTFLIDATGKLVQEWRKVKVTGHAEEVLAKVRELNAVTLD